MTSITSSTSNHNQVNQCRLEVKVLSCFGRDIKGEYTENAEEVVQYLSLPEGLQTNPDVSCNKNMQVQVNWNLNIEHPDDEKRYDGVTYSHLFNWIMQNSKDEQGQPKIPDGYDFICKRRTLQKMMLGNGDGKLLVTRVKGVIHVCDFYGDEDTYRSNNKVIEQSDRIGSKYEHYLLADTPDGKPDPNRPIRCYEDLNVVYEAQLGEFSILYAGEIDGLSDRHTRVDQLDENTKFVELKTTTKPPGGVNKWWWTQSKLANVDWILLGRRSYTDPWIVNSLQWISVTRMENKKNGKALGADYLVRNAQRCLQKIKSHLENLADGEVLLLNRQGTNITLLPNTPPDGKKRVLPEFYQTWLDDMTRVSPRGTKRALTQVHSHGGKKSEKEANKNENE